MMPGYLASLPVHTIYHSERSRFMKKRIISIVLALVFAASLVTPALAASNTGEPKQYGPFYLTIATATFQNAEYGGNLHLTLEASPRASRALLGPLNMFCNVISLLGVSGFDPVCMAADHLEDALDYADSLMRVWIRLLDAETGKVVWEGVMKNGDTIYLGNDHPAGYHVQCKSHQSTIPFVSLEVLDNLELS